MYYCNHSKRSLSKNSKLSLCGSNRDGFDLAGKDGSVEAREMGLKERFKLSWGFLNLQSRLNADKKIDGEEGKPTFNWLKEEIHGWRRTRENNVL